MAEPATGFERGFDHAAYSPIASGPPASANIRRGDGSVDPTQADLASLIRLGAVRQEAGDFAEAERCFRRALEIGDRTLGPDNPDSIILLNDLSRLYLKQSAYGEAEPLLLRLLELKRNKGEDHPEVATVLASLASVRQALGMHESAEQIWRRVLDIRERTLAPNHFATASALEHLGDACAARGKIREALSVFQRALTIREKTLGIEHPSLRVARERIADLQLQASDDMLDPISLDDQPAIPERYRLVSSTPATDSSPSRFAPSSPSPTPQTRLSAKVSSSVEPKAAREKKASLIIPRGYTPPAAPAIDVVKDADPTEMVVMPLPSNEAASASEEGPALRTATVEYLDALESVREELEQSHDDQTIAERAARVVAAVSTFLTAHRRVVVTAGVVIVGASLAGVAFATGKLALGETAQASGQQLQATAQSPLAALGPSTVPAAAAQPVPVTILGAATSAENSSGRTSRTRTTEERTSARKVAEKKPEQPVRVSIPALSTAVLSRLDSAAAKAAAVGSNASEQFKLQPDPAAVSRRRATFEEEQINTAQRAQLIGELPTPKVPAQVSDVEGEVRVRFNVDSLGQPVLQTLSVVSSPNPLLSAAVRKVIPAMRFEPARTAGPDSKPIADVVQIAFQFARSR